MSENIDHELLEPVGSIEIATFLGVKPDTVVQWRHRPQLGFPEPRWTVSGRPAWAWADIKAWSERSGRMVSIVNTEREAKQLIGKTVLIPARGYVPVVGYRKTASGTYVLTSVPQTALDVDASP